MKILKNYRSHKLAGLIAIACMLLPNDALGQQFKLPVQALIESSCIACHDEGSDTGLDLSSLSFDLSNPEDFRAWVKVFDRSIAGEMPPESEDRPDDDILSAALEALKNDLHKTSHRLQQQTGRVSARRLTKLEYKYTLQDLLQISEDVSVNLPDESDSGSFDTVGSSQRISAVHMKSYLQATNVALSAAIQLGENPSRTH